MSGDLRLLNRQRTRSLDLRRLRRVLTSFLDELPAAGEYDLTVQFVTPRAMARLNEKHLQHEGPTDVITLDYAASQAVGVSHSLSPPKGERSPKNGPSTDLIGELFVCVDVAVEQARRFHADWPVELARYVIHGILHLSGHDDHRPAARRRMKQAENRWLKKLDRRFDLSKLGRKRKLAA